MIEVTQINQFYGEDYVNETCSFCPMGQAVVVLHDKGGEGIANMCPSCLRAIRAAPW
jgi:hypothetical protein